MKSWSMNTEAIVKKFIDGFNRHDMSVYEMFSKDWVWQDPGGLEPESGWERGKKGVQLFMESFDLRFQPSSFVKSADKVAVEGTFTGKFHKPITSMGGKDVNISPTNRPLKTSGSIFVYLNENGLISKLNFYWDNLEFYKQMGLRPEQASQQS
jgi:ketosteroid isomerase-like protein